MKRVDLIRGLERAGCEFVRHGGRHDIYRNPATGQQTAIPRHREVADSLCRLIRRQLGLDPPASAGPADEDANPAEA